MERLRVHSQFKVALRLTRRTGELALSSAVELGRYHNRRKRGKKKVSYRSASRDFTKRVLASKRFGNENVVSRDGIKSKSLLGRESPGRDATVTETVPAGVLGPEEAFFLENNGFLHGLAFGTSLIGGRGLF